MQKVTKKGMCRSRAAEYLGVSSRVLKTLPIPYTQYSRFGYAIYQKSDLSAFKKKSTYTPPEEEGVVECA